MKTSNESPPGRREWIGFGCMLVQQAQNAFNDKMAQFLLIPLAAAVGFMIPLGAGREMDVESAAGIMIALPFVLFAPLAGWLSDRFSKRDVMLGSALMQLAVLLMICLAVANRILGLALVGFFLLAIQSAIFSPAKIGMNKELLGTRHLGMAAGVQQMLAILAILGGQVVAGWWFDERLRSQHGQAVDPWWAASGPLWILTFSALPALLLAWLIPRVPAQGKAPFNARVAISHFVHLRDLWQVPALRSCALGIAFFWGMAAWINLWSVKLARELTGGGEGFGTVSSIFMAAASVGMAIGFGIAAIFLRRRIELGWVPVSGMAMTVAAVILGFSDPGKALHYLQIVDSGFIPVGHWPMIELLFLCALAAMAFFSALFLAPINAWIQDRYPADKRGEMQAAVNLQDCLAGILAVILVAVIEFSGSVMGLDPMTGFQLQMMLIAAACLLATILMIRAFPAEMIRMLATRLIRVFYHVRAVGSQRIPESGGVLLLPNHVTYADAFYLSAASPRPIRFVMDDVFAANAAIQWFTRLFDTVNIKREQPMEAIREVISALR
ncbi:MAG: MFS transporter, partial [Luteolibacter sp.]